MEMQYFVKPGEEDKYFEWIYEHPLPQQYMAIFRSTEGVPLANQSMVHATRMPWSVDEFALIEKSYGNSQSVHDFRTFITDEQCSIRDLKSQ